MTELFAQGIYDQRIAGMLAHYDFVTTKTMGYFKRPLDEAPRDAIFPLGFAKQNAKTAASARLSVKR